MSSIVPLASSGGGKLAMLWRGDTGTSPDGMDSVWTEWVATQGRCSPSIVDDTATVSSGLGTRQLCTDDGTCSVRRDHAKREIQR